MIGSRNLRTSATLDARGVIAKTGALLGTKRGRRLHHDPLIVKPKQQGRLFLQHADDAMALVIGDNRLGPAHRAQKKKRRRNVLSYRCCHLVVQKSLVPRLSEPFLWAPDVAASARRRHFARSLRSLRKALHQYQTYYDFHVRCFPLDTPQPGTAMTFPLPPILCLGAQYTEPPSILPSLLTSSQVHESFRPN